MTEQDYEYRQGRSEAQYKSTMICLNYLLYRFDSYFPLYTNKINNNIYETQD